MGLRIAVCLKQVPDPVLFDRIELDKKTGTIIRTGIPAVINPVDRHALEEALKIRDEFGGEVIALSMGPPQAREVMELALAAGADRAVLLSDREFAGADTLATALTLARAIEKLGEIHLVFCGNISVDGSTGQVPAQLAEYLRVPHMSQVEEIKFVSPMAIEVKTKREHGFARARLKLPAVLAVIPTINVWRLLTVSGIMGIETKEIKILTAKELGLTGKVGLDGSPTRVSGISETKVERRGFILSYEEEGAVSQAVKRLRQLGAF